MYLSDFLVIAMIESTNTFKDIAKKIFRYIDANKDGQIDADELVRLKDSHSACACRKLWSVLSDGQQLEGIALTCSDYIVPEFYKCFLFRLRADCRYVSSSL